MIIGGGEIGSQFACIFNKLGVHVTIIEERSRLLLSEDEEISTLFQEILESSSIRVILGAKIKKISKGEKNKKIVIILSGDGDIIVSVEMVVLAMEQKPNTFDLCLNNVCVKVDDSSRILVNNKMETNISGIYAVGDVVGKFMLTNVASAEGFVAADNAMGKSHLMDYKVIPRCIFTIPEVASVGLTEKQAINSGYNVKIGRFPLELNVRSQIRGTVDGFIKIVAEAEYGEILGVHIIGSSATELIHEAAIAMKLEATIEDIADTIHGHPTLSEAFKDAAYRMLLSLSMLEELESI